jgi:hypothetical protein
VAFNHADKKTCRPTFLPLPHGGEVAFSFSIFFVFVIILLALRKKDRREKLWLKINI